MTCAPPAGVERPAEWPDLVAELDRWGEAGQEARLWWRDDDAVAPTPRLDRLLVLAGDIPLALAVIPAEVRPELAAGLIPYPRVAVLQHGWCHANHAAAGKKSEYPAERHPVEVADELAEGRQRLRSVFGARALPVLVPPWNRFADRFAPLLGEAGFAALSRMAPRRSMPPPEIAAVDVDIDVVAWHDDRRFIGTGAALARLIEALRARRHGAADSASPIGLLTHHLVMDAPTEAFIAGLGAAIAAHPAARWAGIAELMAPR